LRISQKTIRVIRDDLPQCERRETMDRSKAGKSRVYTILALVTGLIAGGLIVYFTVHAATPAAPIVVSTPIPTPTPQPTSLPALVRVHVSGAVRLPDVYELPPGSIVKHAVEAAGGPTDDAALDCINMAVELQDQQQIHVPREGESNPPPPLSGGEDGGGVGGGGPININTATAAQLQELPGVGPSTATKIVAYREANGPFAKIEDIMDVPTIGEAKFEGIKDLITVGP
jgi:competence protein ComEA